MFTLPSVARRAATILAGLSMSMALVPAVIAAAPSTQALNPPPPDSYTCNAVGGGTICRSQTSEFALEQSGIVCGTGFGTFEIVDSGIHNVSATRFYNADGNLTRRERIHDFDDTHLTNPLTGASIAYKQHNSDWEVLAVPGDLASATFHGHGVLVVTVAGSGSVMVSAGIEVDAPNGDIIHDGGPNDFRDYFAGDTSVVAALCAALGG